MISKFIEENKENIINNICDLIRFPSVSVNSNTENAPFGTACKQVLDYTLSLANTMGFKTKNLNGYCGYIEFGEGTELLGIIGHLDVVPGGDGWTKCLPFEPTIIDNKIYGRGSIDDKGPVIASLYAMKYVMDTMNVNKRVRLILGLNEEVSWECINYYKKHEESPTIGFSPDADFPCIYAEKGFLNSYVKSTYIPYGNLELEALVCDNAINMVPKSAESIIKISNSNISLDSIQYELEEIIENYNFHINISQLDENKLKLISQGVSAHAAYPDLGVNALSRLLIVLNDIFEKHNTYIPFFKFFKEKIFTEYNGQSLNISCNDESGDLTVNIGNIKFENNEIILGLNIRVPVTIYLSIIKQKIHDASLEYSDILIDFSSEKDALYISPNDPLVTTLCSVFNEVTGLNESPITCSGATYARAFKNVVSFGCNMPGKMDMCHKADEFIEVDDIYTSIEIFIKAIRKLTE